MPVDPKAKGTFRNNLKSIRGKVFPERPKNENVPPQPGRDDRLEAIKVLDALCLDVFDHEGAFLDLAAGSLPRIRVTEIQDNNNTELGKPFFRPFSSSEFDKFPIDWDYSRETRDFGRFWKEGPETASEWMNPDDTRLYEEQANFWNNYALWQFRIAPRPTAIGRLQHRSLKQLADHWIACDRPQVFQDHYLNTLNVETDPRWRVRDAFCAKDGQPHVIVTINLGVEPKEELLRAEAFTMIAAIRTTLFHLDKFEKVPVLLISTLANSNRILQGHFDGENLLIKKSSLMEFKPEDPEASKRIALFLGSKPVPYDVGIRDKGEQEAKAA